MFFLRFSKQLIPASYFLFVFSVTDFPVVLYREDLALWCDNH